ncbi:MAG: ZIP family metal transporter [Clostridia bacterium]|nr:ZIP family metal transporter [Clostridia bacterium]
MNHTLMTVLGIGFIFLMTALGASFVYFFKREFSEKLTALLFGFASGIMLAASVWSLLLPAIEQSTGRFPFIPATVGFLCGGLLIILLAKQMERVKEKSNEDASSLKYMKLFFAVTLHNIPEGLAVGFAFGAASAIGSTAAYVTALGLAFGIGIQNFPEGAAVALPLKSTFKSRKKAFFYGAMSGIVEPFFAVLGYFLAAYLQILQPWLLSFAAGAMVFVVAEDLLPESKTERSAFLCACGVMVGFALMMALDVSLG